MKDLNFDLKNLCKRNPHGSHSTQANRFRGLQMCADQLLDLGYKLQGARSIKPKHIDALVTHWRKGGLTAGTLKNRLGHLRWWAESVGKSSIMKPKNEDYGIEKRQAFNGDKSLKLDMDKLATIKDLHVQMALRLQSAFGLRREEALKFQPRLADRGDHIQLKASWTKGGRARTIPIVNERQRELLDQAAALAKGGSMIPDHLRYIDQLHKYNHEALRAGLNSPHGLRHNYAQWRYQALTGMLPPAKGGIKRCDMSQVHKEVDRDARRIISEELGHGRIDVTNVYLGGAQ